FYRPLTDAPKAHSRIIWDACWAADASFFATASRDKTVKLWHPSPSSSGSTTWTNASTLKFAEAATSIASTRLAGGKHAVAVGLENGEIRLFTRAAEGGEWEEKVVLDSSVAHVLAVTSLSFCPPAKTLPPGVVRLVSGSEDHSVRIFDIEL
ncbi:hypothetical protein JCM8547_003532, partial [Rhodosporidiobolus lusitaniae]